MPKNSGKKESKNHKIAPTPHKMPPPRQFSNHLQAANSARNSSRRPHLASEVMVPEARVVVRMVPGVIEPGSVMAWEPTRVML